MIMYKPYKIKGINRYILAARQKFNATLVPTDEKGIRSIFRHLKQGGLTVILPTIYQNLVAVFIHIFPAKYFVHDTGL